MALVPYLKWLGVSLVVLVAVWLLTRRVASPFRRLALRCLATSAALTPQPLWAPGEGGYVMPALSLLVFGGGPLFSFTMGAFPIFAVATLFFTLVGWRLARAASGAERGRVDPERGRRRLEHVVVSGITMRNVRAPIFVRLAKRGWGQAVPAAGELAKITIANLVATGAEWTSSIMGVPATTCRTSP